METASAALRAERCGIRKWESGGADGVLPDGARLIVHLLIR